MLNEAELVQPSWKVHRLIPSHFPPIDLFEEVADPADLDIVFAIEALTNDRLRQQAGELQLVPKSERVSGHGTTPIMAAFTHIGYESRFSSGQQYGVYYGSKSITTALKETIYHRERFLRLTNEPDTVLTMRCYVNYVCLELHNIQGAAFKHLHSNDYAASQAFASALRKKGSNGLLYNSVRDQGGQCIAAFRPKALTPTTQSEHYQYHWRQIDYKITDVLKVDAVKI